MTRRILLVSHPTREDLKRLIGVVAEQLSDAGIEPAVLPDQTGQYETDRDYLVADPDDPAAGCELVLVLGGDGTILRGAGWARSSGIPLLGINFGHVGFLAEAEPGNLAETIERVIARDYATHERMTLDITAHNGDELIASSWALNEVTVEKIARSGMIHAVIEIDGRPLSTWAGDGVIVATPTGSTAYAFSAGGPVLWPDADAQLIVPVAAHALFARPLVVSPKSTVAVELSRDAMGPAVMLCDGSRSWDLPPHSRVVVRRSEQPVHLVKLDDEPFTDRIVEKFHLPVVGWRGAAGTR